MVPLIANMKIKIKILPTVFLLLVSNKEVRGTLTFHFSFSMSLLSIEKFSVHF